MNCNINAINNYDATLYSVIKGKHIHMPNWQRPYDWGDDEANDMLVEILKTAKNEIADMHKDVSNFGNIIIHEVNDNHIMIADGHTRIMTFRIIMKALLDVCNERNIVIGCPVSCSVQYDLDVAKNEYFAFEKNPEGTTNYAKVYTFVKKKIDGFVVNRTSALRILAAMTDYVMVGVTKCDTVELAHASFVQRNAGGKTLTDREIISSLLQYNMDKFNVRLEYDYNKLKQLVEGYYYYNSKQIEDTFSVGAIRRFMEKHIVDSRESMQLFENYLLKIKDFHETAWYKILHMLGSKSVMMGYVMVAAGYEMDGSDNNVNEFLKDIVVFDLAAFAHSANTGGVVSTEFKKINTAFGGPFTLQEIHQSFLNWVDENKIAYGNQFDVFSKSLDALNDDYKKAVLLFTYMVNNSNSMPTRYEFDHVYPQEPSIVWFRNGFPKAGSAVQARMINGLGNLAMLDKKLNRAVKNAFIDEKKYYYEDFYAANTAYRNTPNFFDCDAFKANPQDYLDKRRDAFARVLADTTVGKILTA